MQPLFCSLSSQPQRAKRSNSSVAMAQQGESAGYYSGAPQQPQQAYNQGQYGQQRYGQQAPMNYGQQPPQYGNNYAPPQGPPPPQHPQQQNGYTEMNYGEKPNFEQAFKIERPKYNDWWAGLLLIAVFLGYVAVSGLAIRGYCELKIRESICASTNSPSAKYWLQWRHLWRPK